MSKKASINFVVVALAILLICLAIALKLALRPPPNNFTSESISISTAVNQSKEKAMTGAVVRIVTFAPAENSEQLVEIAQGSGFFLEPHGLLATAWHVLDGAAAIKIQTADGLREWDSVRIAGHDRLADMVLLVVDNPPSEMLQLGNCSGLGPGEPIAVIGFPATGENIELRKGKFAGRHPLSNFSSWLMLDITLAPGISGGPVLEMAEMTVVGMASLADAGADEDTDTTGQQGIAIPGEAVSAMCDYADLDNPQSLRAWQNHVQQQKAWLAITGDHRYKRISEQIKAGNYSGAKHGLQTLLLLDRNSDNPWLMLKAGNIYEELGDMDSARIYFAKAARTGATAMAWVEFARISRKMGLVQPDEYRLLIHNAVIINPTSALLWKKLAMAFLEEDDEAAAVQALNRSETLQPAQ